MSRIGIKPISLPETIQMDIQPTVAVVKGPLGELTVAIPYGIKVSQKDNLVNVNRINNSKPYRSLHGTVRNLLSNAAQGVTAGFQKQLELVGIGYRANVEGNVLNIQVGYTHPVVFTVPEDLQVKVEKNTITITGTDKQHVGEFAAVVRRTREPEPYKGKGIRYSGERVRQKQGKAVKAAG